MQLPPVPSQAELEAQVTLMVETMNDMPYVVDRLRWLDENGWLMPRDTIALCEMLDHAEQMLVDNNIIATTKGVVEV